MLLYFFVCGGCISMMCILIFCVWVVCSVFVIVGGICV